MQLFKEKIIEAINEIKYCIEVTNYTIKKVNIREKILDNPNYKYIYTVENLNELVNGGMSFRDAYVKVSESIKQKNYVPKKNNKHTLVGSINNLCLNEIKNKMKINFN